MTFKELGLHPTLLRALKDLGYERPTPIQAKAIPLLLEGHDLLGVAQTGTGKTASFALPILHRMEDGSRGKHEKRHIKALVVTPTRELAIQVNDSFTSYGKHTYFRNTVIFGGVKQHAQVREIQRGIDILVATPGRLLDLIGQGYISLDRIEYFVLDEADHMLDMGFIHDIRRIIKLLPQRRQSLFFSATMPKEIVSLSKKILHDPRRVTIKPEQTTAERVSQLYYRVNKRDKRRLLLHLLRQKDMDTTLVFTRTKHGADRVVRQLSKAKIDAAAIHGNKSQGQRQRALNRFKEGDLKVLVATDIAARGIDVDDLSHVVNFDLPNVSETYVHRIGRTGRASASGTAISFCDVEEKPYLRDIEKLIQQRIEEIEDHPYLPEGAEEREQEREQQRQNRPNPAPRNQEDGAKQGAGKKKRRNRNRNRRR